MKIGSALRLAIAGLLVTAQVARATTPKQQQGGSTAILMQGWDWDSPGYGNPDWYGIMKAQAADMKALGVTHVWFPPSADSAAVQGYMPRELNVLSNNYGTEAELKAAIQAFAKQGIQSIADVVINHRAGTSSVYGAFTNPSWGSSAIVSNDECKCGTGAPDTGTGFDLAPDLDHTNTQVANGIIAFMASLKQIGFTGMRYDYALGYRAGLEESYTNQFVPDFCVAEVWNKLTSFDNASVGANRQLEVSFMKGDGASCTNSSDPYCGGGNQMSCGTFDYTTHELMVEALTYNDYYLLKNQTGTGPAGVIGQLPAMEVTFVDNHDTGPAENCNVGQNEEPVPCWSVMQGYAYILTHPGIPTIFYPHVYYWGLRSQILALVNARHKAGITSTSPVSIQTAISGLYAAIITGGAHRLAMKIGPNSWSPTGGTGWTLLTSGTDYAVWISE